MGVSDLLSGACCVCLGGEKGLAAITDTDSHHEWGPIFNRTLSIKPTSTKFYGDIFLSGQPSLINTGHRFRSH